MPLSFPREVGLRRSVCENANDFRSYVLKINGKSSCYTSLYGFKDRHPIQHWKIDTDSVVIDRAWWDFDTQEGGCLSDVENDVRTLLNRLTGDVRLVFTGRGFHIHQFFQNPVFGRAIARHIDRYQRDIASDLKTLDGVGHPQKLTRIPDTYNVKREKWAVNICAETFMRDPLFKIPDKPDPRFAHLDPFIGNNPSSSFDILSWIAKNPIEERVTLSEFSGDITAIGQVPIPPCLENAIRHENPRHHVRVALAQHLAENLRWFAAPSSLTPEQRRDIVDKIVTFMATLNWRDYNEGTTRFHVDSLMNYESSPSSSWYRNHGLCDGTNCWAHGGN